jgi:formylglycine-generating enzyme required for sulfatase activity
MAGGLGAVVVAAILLFGPTPRGVVKIESDDPDVVIVFDKTGPTVKGTDRQPIPLRAGEHGVLIKRGDFQFEADKFILKKGATITLKVELLPGTIQVAANGQVIGAKKLPPVAAAGASPGELPKTFTNSLGMELVLVPKGKSWLGGGGGRPGNKEVGIAHDFYLGKYEVTQEEWKKVTGLTPSQFSRTGPGKNVVKDIADADLKRFPVENVSWHDAQLFLAAVNEREKDAGWIYRLPKEAEWEFACRGGPVSDPLDSAYDYYFDKPTNQLSAELANYEARQGWRTCKVGLYKPNQLGLYDMHGNVWEWCDDTQKADRVLRGGSWAASPWQLCRAAGRIARPTSTRSYDIGLRLARLPVGK